MNNTPSLLLERISPIVEPVHEAFEMSRNRFTTIPGLCRDDQGWARTAFLRCFLWQYLNDNPLPEPWALAGRHAQNGAINFAFDSGQIAVRVVHALPSGTAPPAGHNHARRAYYTNQALAEVSDSAHIPTHRMLLTWHEPDLLSNPDAPFDLTMLRPLTPGSLRTRVRADVVLPLPRERTAFEDLSFDTSDELDLDEFEIDERDAGDGN